MSHGVRALARALRNENQAQVRLDVRLKRARNRVRRLHDEQPLEAIRAGLIVSIADDVILEKRANDAFHAATDLSQQTGLAKFVALISNRLRRNRELLVLVEAQLNPGATSTPSFVVLPAAPPETVELWAADYARVVEEPAP